MACFSNERYGGTEVLRTRPSGNQHPVQPHLATLTHLGKKEGRRGSGRTMLDPIFPIPWLLCLSLPVSRERVEGQSPMPFFLGHDAITSPTHSL